MEFVGPVATAADLLPVPVPVPPATRGPGWIERRAWCVPRRSQAARVFQQPHVV